MTVSPPKSNSTANPTVWGYHGRLGDILFRFAVSEREPFTIQREYSQRDMVNTEANPEDFTDDFGLTFSQVEFNGGEGLRFAHRPSTRQVDKETFFYRSYGLRLNDDFDLEVVNQMEEIITGAGPSPESRAAYDPQDETIYYTDGSTDLATITDLNSNPPTTGTEATGATNALEDVVHLGNANYVCDGTAIRDDGGGSWAQWSDLNAVRLWRAKNRIIASDGRRLYEDPIGTGVSTGDAFITLPAGEEWVDLVDEGEYVVAVASDGELYTFSFDGTSLSLAGEVELHRETITAVGALYGGVLVMTYQQSDDSTFIQRIWRGTLNQQGTFDDLQVLREWTTDTVAQISKDLDEAERDNIYWTVDDGTDLVLWRYNLEDGYIMSDEIMDGLTGAQANWIAKVKGRFWVVTDNGDVWRELPSTKRASGKFIGPAIDFFNAQPKAWEELTLIADYPAGAEVKAYVSTDTASMDTPDDDEQWTLVRTYKNDDRPVTALTTDASRYLVARIDVIGEAVMRAYTVRALPPLSDEQVLLRINASDDVFRPGKKRQRVRGLGEAIWRGIRDLQDQSVDLVLYDLDTIWRGTLIQIGTPVPTYRPDGSLTKVMEVVFRGEPLTLTTADENTWGSAQWGVGLWGSNEVS